MNKPKVNNIFRIPCSSIEVFYRLWIDFLTPIHKLTAKNREILVSFLVLRHELSEDISNEILLDEVLMSKESKEKVKERCGLQQNQLQVALYNLTKHNVLLKLPVDEFGGKFKYKINPRILPDVRIDDTNVVLQLNFDMKWLSQKKDI